MLPHIVTPCPFRPSLRPLPHPQAWAQRLTAVSPRLQGPIYFLIGTDWEDAPIGGGGWPRFLDVACWWEGGVSVQSYRALAQ